MAPKAKPELTYFGLALRRIMKNMGYDFEYPRGLNGGKGITKPLKPYLRKDLEEEKRKPHRRVLASVQLLLHLIYESIKRD